MSLILPVIGMHRSGTSFVVRALSCLGVSLGDNLLAGGADNPLGYFEDVSFLDLNCRLLSEFEADFLTMRGLDHDCSRIGNDHPLFAEAAQLVLSRCQQYPVFAFKDPRTAILLEFWQRVFSGLEVEVGYVIVLRHPMSVAASLKMRDKISLFGGYFRWLRHTESAIRRSEKFARCIVLYERLMKSPHAELERIAARLALPLPTDFSARVNVFEKEFVCRELNHHPEGSVSVLDPAAEAAVQFYEDIVASIDQPESAGQNTLELVTKEVRQGLEESSPLLLALETSECLVSSYARDLRRLECEREQLLKVVGTVGCQLAIQLGSWLNRYPRFLSIVSWLGSFFLKRIRGRPAAN